MNGNRGPRKSSYAHQVRKALQKLSPKGESLTMVALAEELDHVSPEDKGRMHRTVRDFVKRGEVARVATGVIRYLPKIQGRSDREKMWAVIRSEKKITVEKIMMMAEVSQPYALEFLNICVRNGILRKYNLGPNPHTWRMIVDPVEMPESLSQANAVKLRRLREKQRLVEAAFTAAELAIKKGREAVADMAAIAKE